MARKKRARLLLHRTNPITKAAILAAAILSVVALVALYSAVDRLDEQFDTMRRQAMELESDQSQLRQQIDGLGSQESALRIASEELGLAFPDAVIVDPDDD